jgi:hypothetical protein
MLSEQATIATPTTETNFDCIFIASSCDVITDNFPRLSLLDFGCGERVKGGCYHRNNRPVVSSM